MANPKRKPEAQVYLDSVIKNMPQHVYVFWKDKNSIYLGCTENYAKLIGLSSPEEIIGKSDIDIGWLPDGDTAELFRRGDIETMQGKHVVNQEELLSLPNGKKLFTLVSKSAIQDDKGNIIGIMGIATDITERKNTEEAIKEAKVATEKMQAMKTLAASIAHELRTPLRTIDSASAGIKTYFPLVLEAYKLAKKEKLPVPKIDPSHFKALLSSCDLIVSEVEEAFTIINMLLTNLSEGADPTTNMEFKTYFIKDCIDKAIQRYPFDMDEEGLVSCLSVPNFKFKGNDLLIVHILFNLLKNALYQIKAARRGSIVIWTELAKDFNRLHFKDTAKGIPSDALPYIFDQFFTNTYHGTGIGLAFCRMVMEKIGGRIACESKEGEYAEFILYFPVDE